MKGLTQILICVAILALVGVIGAILFLTKPEAEKSATEKVLPTVEVMDVRPESVTLRLPTQGLIVPAKQSTLASEVAGKVIWVSDKFKTGGEFDENEPLIRIDKSDYEAAFAEANARVADTRLALTQEEAQAERALRDWKELGLGGEPTDLVLRKPQLDSAKARVAAAEAAVKKAENDVKRTEIRAPYKARVQQIHTEVGSYVGPAAPVADVYAVAPFELSLPLSLDEYAFVAAGTEAEGPTVWLSADAGIQQLSWTAEVVRDAGEINRDSRSINLIATVEAGKNDLLQPGLFVQAEVEGLTLSNVVRVPLKAFHSRDELVIVGKGNRLNFRQVTVLRRQGDEALVSAGLDPGERICTTALEAVVEGMEVEISETAPPAAADPVPLADQPKT